MPRAQVVYLSRNDGSDMRISKEVRTLTELDLEVIFVGWDWGQSQDGRSTLPSQVHQRVFRGGRSPWTAIRFAAFALRCLARTRPEVVHAANEEMAGLAALLKPLLRYHVVADLFDSLELKAPDSPKGQAIRSAARLAQRAADIVVVTDERRKGELRRSVLSKAVVVGNFPVDPGKHLSETELGSPIRVLVAGTLSSARGLETIVSAAREEDAQIVAAGWPLDEAGRRFVDNPEVDYKGVLDQTSALELAASCHAILAHYAPTNRNNILASPNKVYDSLCVGRLLLINSEARVSMWVESVGAGIATPYGDAVALAAALKQVAAAEPWTETSRQLRDLFADAYSWEAAAAVLADAYGKLSRVPSDD